MAFTPLAGKTGRVGWGATNLFMKDWSLTVEADLIPADGFEKTAVVSEYYHDWIAGLHGGEATVSGLWDHQDAKYLSGASLLLRAGRTAASGGTVASVFLGLTTTIGYTLTGIIRRINPTNDVAGAAMFSFTLAVSGVTYTLQT